MIPQKYSVHYWVKIFRFATLFFWCILHIYLQILKEYLSPNFACKTGFNFYILFKKELLFIPINFMIYQDKNAIQLMYRIEKLFNRLIRYKFNMTMKNVEIVSIVIITLITPKVFRSLNFLCGNHSSSNHFKCKAHYFETASSFWASHSRWSFYCFTQTRIDHSYNVCKK